MPGLLHITVTALLASCDAFRLGSSQRAIPLSPPVTHLFRDEGQTQPHFIQELVRTKRHSVQELVSYHSVHYLQTKSRSQAKIKSANSSEEDEMERMVHLAIPQDAEDYIEDSTKPKAELLHRPGAGDSSLEASGAYGTDMEDRDRGEEGGEGRERTGGEDEWEKDIVEDSERMEEDAREEEDEKGGGRDNRDVLDAFGLNHTTPDLDTLIGYSPSFNPSSSKQPSISFPAEGHESGLQEHRSSSVLEVGPLEKELWETDGEEDVLSSGYGVLRSSIGTTSPTSSAAATAAVDAVGTATPETDTGTDFGLLGSYTKGETEDEEAEREEEEEETGLTHIGTFTQTPTVAEVGLAPSREPLQPSVEKGFRAKDRSEEVGEEKWKKMESEKTRIRHIMPLTTGPAPTIGFTDPSWDWQERTTPPQEDKSEVRGGGVAEVLLPDSDLSGLEVTHQVVCVDWSELTGRGYVILNMTHNINCEEFRADQGGRLLKTIERVFARRMSSPEGTWVIYLSKPTHQQHQLLMNVASMHGVIPTKDMLGMLAEIRTCLTEVGIQNYSAASNCPSRPSQTRSDYGKLFVVLVIIGSICMVIITSGFIYICWQRRLPATKTALRAEELHFVVNGCHDNPTLDVTNDSHPEMQEKKPSTNGLAGGGGGGGRGGNGGGEDSSRWQVFVNQAATEEEEEEQDTHL